MVGFFLSEEGPGASRRCRATALILAATQIRACALALRRAQGERYTEPIAKNPFVPGHMIAYNPVRPELVEA
jgi:hypothetical protein